MAHLAAVATVADLVQRPALDSTTLLAGQKQVAIRHGDELYSLRSHIDMVRQRVGAGVAGEV